MINTTNNKLSNKLEISMKWFSTAKNGNAVHGELDRRGSDKAWFPCMCQQDAQQRAMPLDVWTPMITNDHSLRNKNLRARNKVAHVELLRGLARPVPL